MSKEGKLLRNMKQAVLQRCHLIFKIPFPARNSILQHSHKDVLQCPHNVKHIFNLTMRQCRLMLQDISEMMWRIMNALNKSADNLNRNFGWFAQKLQKVTKAILMQSLKIKEEKYFKVWSHKNLMNSEQSALSWNLYMLWLEFERELYIASQVHEYLIWPILTLSSVFWCNTMAQTKEWINWGTIPKICLWGSPSGNTSTSLAINSTLCSHIFTFCWQVAADEIHFAIISIEDAMVSTVTAMLSGLHAGLVGSKQVKLESNRRLWRNLLCSVSSIGAWLDIVLGSWIASEAAVTACGLRLDGVSRGSTGPA